MSAGDGDYIETFDPDGDVLWFWYQTWHCNSTTKDNESTEQTKRVVRIALSRFERFLAAQTGNQSYDCHWSDIDIDSVSYDDIIPPREVTPQLAEQFLVDLQKTYAADTQQFTYATVKQAYEWCEESVESVEADPFAVVEKKHKEKNNDWILETPDERNPYIIPISEAREVVRSWKNPMWLSIQLLLAKYTRRVGSISNLDVENVHLNHPGCDWTVHPDLRQWPNHISFRADKRASDAGRNTGNKTKTNAVYPIDPELKDTLLWYLTIRPQPDTPTDPLFITHQKGERLSGSSIGGKFRERAKDLGYWYGANDDDNLNPHYWRHWATSWYQSQFGGNESQGRTALTKYLRGDSKQDIIGIYDSYTEDKRDTILDAMPTFLESYVEDE
jgi:integrase